MSRPVVVLAGRHRPHELLFLVVSLLVGVAFIVGAPPPGSLTAALPGWAVLVWSVGMAASGVLGLVGAWRSLRLEQAAMLLGASALVWYVAAVAQFGWRALLAGLICAAWACANLWRAWQIRRDLRGLG
jgi:hypothetical protein